MRIIFLIILSFSAFSFETQVIVRGEKDKLIPRKVTLENLKEDLYFETPFFKLVKGTTDEVIKTTDEKLLRKSATILYHLDIARKYFETLGKPQTEQLIIRVDIQNAYHKRFHFQNPQVSPVFNNATTIAAGTGDAMFGIEPWGNEIWFRPVKKIAITKEFRKKYKKMLRDSLPRRSNIDTDVLIFTALNASVSSDISGSLETSGKTLLTNFLIDSFIRVAVPELASLFLGKEFYFDASFVPEVMYHEYSHYAMSDSVAPEVNSSILEGFADYFATKVSGIDQLAHELGDYGKLAKSRSAINKIAFDLNLDTKLGVGTDFVLSVLHDVERYISKYEGDTFVQKRLFEMRKGLSVDTNIREGLPALFWEFFPEYGVETSILLNNRGI